MTTEGGRVHEVPPGRRCGMGTLGGGVGDKEQGLSTREDGSGERIEGWDLTESTGKEIG